MKICTKCNQSKPTREFYKKEKGRYYAECRSCFKLRMYERIDEISKFIFNSKGDSCEICGYNKCKAALEFHHNDPTKKEFNISSAWSYNMDRIKKEIGKCILVCSNCHREIHENMRKEHAVAGVTTELSAK